MARDEPDRIGWDGPHDKLIRQVKPRIGDFQQRQDVIGAIFLEIEIIKIRVAQFPGVPQHLKHLILRKVQPILPDVAALEIPILLDFQIIGHRGEIAFESPGHAHIGVCEAVARGDLSSIIDGIRQDAGLLGLAFLIDPKQQVAEHRRWIVHKRRGENEGDTLRVQRAQPVCEPDARFGEEPSVVNRKDRFQPVISRRERALGILGRSAYQLIGEQLPECGFEFRGGVCFPVGCQKKCRPVRFTRKAFPQIFPVMQQEMPLSSIRETQFDRLPEKFIEVCRISSI